MATSRRASCLTRDLSLGVHVRLVAPTEARIIRIMETSGLGRQAALERIEDLDASRSRLVRRYFQRDVEDHLLYDAVWNTDDLPFETIADLIVRMVEDRARRLEREPAEAA